MSVDFLQKLWGCLGVTAPDTELAAQLAAGPLSLNMPVRQVDEEPAGQRSAAGCAWGYVAGHCV